MEDKKILINQIKTPDGTILVSTHRHDYVTYEDKNGLEYMVDGGTSYLRRNVHETPYGFWGKLLNSLYKIFGKERKDPVDYTEMSIYQGDDIDFKYFRTVFCRGGRGKDGRQPLTWVPLAEMNDAWVMATITYEEVRRPDNEFLPYFSQEIEYRLANNIIIEE